MSFNYTSHREVRDNLQICAETCNQHFNITVPAASVYEGDIAPVENVTNILYQSPAIFGKLLFKVDVNFTNIENSEMLIPDFYWKSDVAYFKWFHKLSGIPGILYLLGNSDLQFFVLTGELLAEKSLEIYSPGDLATSWDRIEDEARDQILKKIIDDSITLIKCGERFCFKSEPHIKRLIQDFGLSITYEDIYQKYCAENHLITALHFKRVA